MTTRVGKKPAAPRKRAYHHGDLRQALVDATLKLIATEDVGAVSLREVARRAGVTAAAPYHHFRDKDALLAAVAEEGYRALNQRMDESLSSIRAPRTDNQLRALARCYVRFAVEHPAHYRVMFRQEWGDEEKYASLHAEGMRAYGRLQELAKETTGGKVDMDTLAFTVWAWVHGLASLWNEGPLRKKTRSDSIEPLLERSVELFVGWVMPK
ncbi:TetR/AcrR family transcriptional regulator [Myxococcus llanfairpwllgwyngyllgogerychwyrndrobwllllantysiliogogogochensis]|uniref:TetR/AcrR family transcriptional regulator n=1 Tax=Myxococcus llanfairpwllgwyngyllgogerychwyrndrobwllllantysiliogogogochensis TaxID=2590453 RepID=A0A540X5X4_9BACT|nr:TetR/AcrR family transcriptional regulator [Myxococcus llanfairpwllgwyngyllgogerychwyrndrobwllllantysiliogogogochensis]TQF16665.1 TetR/AcrR family transcriptional regulator [Myxococcus llanfairpwllgwyngyllgogerychwyrndrobwllllantysiliogogogochensis]